MGQEINRLIEEDPELFKKRAERTREEIPKFAKATKKKMEKQMKGMGGMMGGMMDMFDDSMLIEPLNAAIDMMIDLAELAIEAKKEGGALAMKDKIDVLEAKSGKSGDVEVEVEVEVEVQTPK